MKIILCKWWVMYHIHLVDTSRKEYVEIRINRSNHNTFSFVPYFHHILEFIMFISFLSFIVFSCFFFNMKSCESPFHCLISIKLLAIFRLCHPIIFILNPFISDSCQIKRNITPMYTNNRLLFPIRLHPSRCTPTLHTCECDRFSTPKYTEYVCDTRTCTFATTGAKNRQNRRGGETGEQRDKDHWRQRDRRMSQAGLLGNDRRPLDIDEPTFADVDGFVGRQAPKRTSATDHVCVFLMIFLLFRKENGKYLIFFNDLICFGSCSLIRIVVLFADSNSSLFNVLIPIKLWIVVLLKNIWS